MPSKSNKNLFNYIQVKFLSIIVFKQSNCDKIVSYSLLSKKI